MEKSKYILAIDQGTSATKSLIFNEAGQAIAKGSEKLHTDYLDNGFVEQDPEVIFENVLVSVKNCLHQFTQKGFNIDQIVSIGISNQRETFILWDEDGKPLYNAIVWQCKRSIAICEKLKELNFQDSIKLTTGLFIDPYFSGTKVIWLYENNERVKAAIDGGNAYFGTVDTWLLFKLTGGTNYFTDYTNASRTLFFNLATLSWDKELLQKLGLSKLNLPECRPSSYLFGETTISGLLDIPIPIAAMIGDSHAASFGEGCFNPGTAKATMGTGCSVLMNIGDEIKYSGNGMVTTICWSTADKVQYALEGVIVTCGAAIDWLKNELNLFADSTETASMAKSVKDNNGVYLVSAFSGLGAPYWDMKRRASISGLTFGTNKNHIVRAALESIPYQIKDVIVAMEMDTAITLSQLMIDGGISSNEFIVQFLADLLNRPVENIGMADVSALGAAYLAGLRVHIFKDLEQLKQLQTGKRIIVPERNDNIESWYEGWKSAVGS